MSLLPTTIDQGTNARSWSFAQRLSVRSVAFAATIAVVSYLVLVPLVMLLYASVRSTEDKLPFESTTTTLANYAVIFTNPAIFPIFWNTLLFTLGSLAVGLPVAIALAWLLERTALPARGWISTL